MFINIELKFTNVKYYRGGGKGAKCRLRKNQNYSLYIDSDTFEKYINYSKEFLLNLLIFRTEQRVVPTKNTRVILRRSTSFKNNLGNWETNTEKITK